MKKNKKAPAKKPVLVNFILDKSGSMSSVQAETIQGFNTYLDSLKDDKKAEYLFSFTLFNTATDPRHVAIPLTELKPLSTDNYRPDGYTALYDAIGETVRRVEDKKPDVEKVLTVIMTDGHENASREWTLPRIKELISRKEKEGNWTFVFLGATPDAWDIGATMGVSVSNAYQYDQHTTGNVLRAMACSTSNYAASASLKMDNALGNNRWVKNKKI